MRRLIRASESQSHCADFSVHQSRVQPLESKLGEYEFRYPSSHLRHQELLDYIHRVDDENKKLKAQVEYLMEKYNPVAAAIKKIQTPESPGFSMESPEHSSGRRLRKKSFAHSGKYHK
jgi:hypothetical protein